MKQWCRSGLIVSRFGTTNFDEYGSGSSPDLGQQNQQIDFKNSLKEKKTLFIFKSVPEP